MGSYYIVGYYSTNSAEDGKYRRITVKLTNGMQGVKLEHRPGYWASKTWGKMNGQDKEQQLKEAISAGDPDHGPAAGARRSIISACRRACISFRFR